MTCPDEDTLLRFAQGQATDGEHAGIAAHLDACEDCRGAVAEAGRALFPDAPAALLTGAATATPASAASAGESALPLAPGTHVSRYELRDVLGMGGVGVVYRAHDPELLRPVALKLMRPDTSAGGSRGGAQARLLREARAMAQLSHPNVVNVYDAGTYEGQVFVVMELVEGATLASWLHGWSPPWQQTLDLFLDAGRGLAAAHAAGLVHRDFKPENVLVGADGRARVTDFGLVRATGASLLGPGARAALGDAGPGATAPAAPASAESGAPGVTRFAGTPAYMAPEQFLGKETDARTDQFSFCVALYVALYGEHPFGFRPRRGEPLQRLAEPVVAGRLRPPPPDSPVPEGLRQILLRGLRVAPEERFPSLDELLAALGRWRRPPATPLARVLRLTGVVAAGSALLAAALLVGTRKGREWLSAVGSRCGNGVVETGEPCDDGNGSDADACLGSCRFAACGDGHVRTPVEECDDGNRRDGDGCSAACLRCRAGDASFVWSENQHCFTRHDRPVTFAEARRICGASGGDVVSLTGSFEARAVHDALVEPAGVQPWIGLVDADGSGRYVWLTGEPGSNINLQTPEPPSTGAGRCARLVSGRVKSGDFLPMHWLATDCEATAPALCEQAPWLLRPRDNHAYLVVSRPATWDAAAADCSRRGGHLATIGDADEQSYVAAQVFGDLWLGGTDREQERSFRWVTGEPFVYRAFVPNEPDDRDGASDCVVLGSDKGWHDRACDQMNAYICEVD